MAVRLLRLLRGSFGKKRGERGTGDIEEEEGGTVDNEGRWPPSGRSTSLQTALPTLIPPPTRLRTRTPPIPSSGTLDHLFPNAEYPSGQRTSPAASLAGSPAHSHAIPPGNGFSTFLREYRRQMVLDDPFDHDEEDYLAASSHHSSWQGSSTYRNGCCSSIHTHVQDLVGGFSDEEPLINEDEGDDSDDESHSESFRCKTASEIERAWQAREAELARDLRAGRAGSVGAFT
ncbi:hypothetical protein Rt10032_c08g3576 [Rhodotorula toruloides]|uniref:Uncharacterized protein n=1 Tax=Rhodotorula toruloides TaxID=5286 RepID=A0A511KGR1_RHOTO|nr:hypothetical protein Rt10032_c08g3576 [Rhodotorula toruloides]